MKNLIVLPQRLSAVEFLDAVIPFAEELCGYTSGYTIGFIASEPLLIRCKSLVDGNGEHFWAAGLEPGSPGWLLGYPIVINRFVTRLLFGDLSFVGE